MTKTFLPALAALLALVAPAALSAQDNAVTPPELRDFSLPGTRTTPPAPVQPTQAPPAPTTSDQAPAREAPAPMPQPARPAPAEPAPAPAETRVQVVPESAAPPPVAEPAAPVPAPITAPPPAPEPPPAPAEPASDFAWTPWAYGAAAAAALLLAFLFLRRRRAAEGEAPAFVPAPADPPPPPRPAIVPPRPAPKVDVDFRPERLVATETQATVHFELTVKNLGDAPAKGLRIEARLFNASGSEAAEVDAFFTAPLETSTASAGLLLPAGRGVQLTSAVAIPRERMRVVELGGRPLFIPTVAIKIVHEDGDAASTRIARRYLVGTEPREPSAKMGAFRMDTGPRIYRAVTQRPIAA